MSTQAAAPTQQEQAVAYALAQQQQQQQQEEEEEEEQAAAAQMLEDLEAAAPSGLDPTSEQELAAPDEQGLGAGTAATAATAALLQAALPPPSEHNTHFLVANASPMVDGMSPSSSPHAPTPFCTLELRQLLLSRWTSVREALIEAKLFGADAEFLSVTDITTLFTMALGEPLEVAQIQDMATAERSMADLEALSRVQSGASALFSSMQGLDSTSHVKSTVMRRDLIFSLAAVAPHEAFGAWASRMLVLKGYEAFEDLPMLLPATSSGPPDRKSHLDRDQFCEIVALLNGNLDDASVWFEALLSAQARGEAVKDPRLLDLRVLHRLALTRPQLSLLPVSTCRESLPTIAEVLVRLLAVWDNLTAAFGLVVPASSVAPGGVGSSINNHSHSSSILLNNINCSNHQSNNHNNSTSSISPRSRSDFSPCPPSKSSSRKSLPRNATIHDIRQQVLEGIPQSYGGLSQSSSASHLGHSRGASPRRRNSGWKPSRGHWARALPGRHGRYLYLERDTRVLSDQLSAISDLQLQHLPQLSSVQDSLLGGSNGNNNNNSSSNLHINGGSGSILTGHSVAGSHNGGGAADMFSTVGDRLLIPKSECCPGEILAVRYNLSDWGFWGACGPPPAVAAARRLALGSRPFVALLPFDEHNDGSPEALQALAGLGAFGAPIDSHLSVGSVLLRMPQLPEDAEFVSASDGQGDSPAPAAPGGTITHWQLRLFGSEDGLNPTSILSWPVHVQVSTLTPQPPDAVCAVESRHNGVTLRWSATASAGGAPVLWYEAAIFAWSESNSQLNFKQAPVWTGKTPSLTVSVSALQPSTFYVARIRCGNRAGSGGWSNPSAPFLTLPPLPSKPTPPIVEARASSQAVLSWTPPDGPTGEPIVGFSVMTEFVLHAMEPTPSKAPVEQYFEGSGTGGTIKSLAGNTEYVFRVRAHNVSGPGEWSDQSIPLVTAPGPPHAPAAPSYDEASSDGLHLIWAGPHNDGGSNIVTYLLRATPAEGWAGDVPAPVVELEVAGTQLSTWLRGLRGNSWYDVSVTAQNQFGPSDESPLLRAKTGPLPPAAPSASPQLPLVGVGEASMQMGMLGSGGTMAGTPSGAEGKFAEPSAEGLPLVWQPPPDDNGAPVTHYHIVVTAQKSREPFLTHTVESSPELPLSTVLPPLPGSVHFNITVVAENVAGKSPPSGKFLVKTTPTIPGTPPYPPRLHKDLPNGRSSTLPAPTSLSLRWDPPVRDGGSAIRGYEVFVALAEQFEREAQTQEEEGLARPMLSNSTAEMSAQSFPQWQLATDASCSLVVGDLQPDTGYCFAVRAINVRGVSDCSPWSEPIRTAPPAPLAPFPPRLLESTAKSIALEWEEPASSAPVLDYEVCCGLYSAMEPAARTSPSTSASLLRRHRTNRTALRITSLKPGSTYGFRVRARSASGWSAWSHLSEAIETGDNYSFEDIKTTILRRFGCSVVSAFRAFDRNGDGVVTMEEFVLTFDDSSTTSPIPLAQRRSLFLAADPSRSAKLSFKDFSQFFQQRRSAASSSNTNNNTNNNHNANGNNTSNGNSQPEGVGSEGAAVPTASYGGGQPMAAIISAVPEEIETVHSNRCSSKTLPDPKVISIVERLNAPRTRQPRSSSERPLQGSASQTTLGSASNAAPSSAQRPFPQRSRSVEDWRQELSSPGTAKRTRSPPSRSSTSTTNPRPVVSPSSGSSPSTRTRGPLSPPGSGLVGQGQGKPLSTATAASGGGASAPGVTRAPRAGPTSSAAASRSGASLPNGHTAPSTTGGSNSAVGSANGIPRATRGTSPPSRTGSSSLQQPVGPPAAVLSGSGRVGSSLRPKAAWEADGAASTRVLLQALKDGRKHTNTRSAATFTPLGATRA